ncbi:uncharacterized protein LOC123557283 [Mercenaria mercenaria]|uniref:uncharacterized protein LOC123557283 n=1 Tax=Mercenaria mercenaria TaxID=6596 RepID=UPI00234E9477|nr:uncharacterized protein LOC123557283 [Mercenaria mercenaria]
MKMIYNNRIYFGICILVCCCAEEPSCASHFDYEYRTVQKLFELEQRIEQLSHKGGVSVYVRWGRNTCPVDATLVYNGYSAGKKWNDKGSGSDTICLPSEPTWLKYHDGDDASRGHIYGTETDVPSSKNIFDYEVNNQDSPCAVCSVQRSNPDDSWKVKLLRWMETRIQWVSDVRLL